MRYKTFFKFGSWALIVTAGIHALSFVSNPVPANDSERQMLDLIQHYKMDMGAGIQRSMQDIITFFSMTVSLMALSIGILNLIVCRYFDNKELARKVVTFNAVLWTLYLVPLYILTFVPPEVCYTIDALGFGAAWFLFPRQ